MFSIKDILEVANILNIDFSNELQSEIYYYISGEYKTNYINDEEYKFHKETNTWIKNKGLIDYLIEGIYKVREIQDKYKINIEIRELSTIDELNEELPLSIKEELFKIMRKLDSSILLDLENKQKDRVMCNGSYANNIWAIKRLIDLSVEELYNGNIKFLL